MTNSASPRDLALELGEAIQQYRILLPPDFINGLQPLGPGTVYTSWVTLWLLVYQRLHANATLAQAVSELFQSALPLPDNRRVRDGSLSHVTSAYSRARSRLPLEVVQKAADHVFRTFYEGAPPSWKGQRVFIIDGTTLPLASSAELRAEWPPAGNLRGPSAWPVLHLAVAHDMRTGAALRPEAGAMYGDKAVAETALAVRILTRIPPRSLLMADRNFGIFAFVYAAVRAGHDTVTRLTEARFAALQRRAEAEGPGTWKLRWEPSPAERRRHIDLPADAAVEIRLHEFQGYSGQTLWIATTRTATGEELAELYAERAAVEQDIRSLKQALQGSEIRGRSVAMVLKEVAVVALVHNLVIQVRRIAADRAGVAPRRISYSSVKALLMPLLIRGLDLTAEEWERRFEIILRGAWEYRLPLRPRRSYPRTVLGKSPRYPKKSPRQLK